jgi:hypothetical protein
VPVPRTYDAFMSDTGRTTVLEAIERLLGEWRDGVEPAGWENVTVPEYLGALAAWLHDSDGYYANEGRIAPDGWTVMADAMHAAAIYE